MKPLQVQSSCSCTTCRYGSVSKSVKGGTKIERLFYDKYLPLRERKLVDKLIKTRVIYDDVRNQILSRSNVNDEERTNVKLRGDSSFDDDVERSSALLEIVSLVDKGDGVSPKLSECCSCCTCGSKSELHGRRHRNGRHVTHHHDRGGSRLSLKSGVISKRRAKEGRRYKSRGVQFKHIRSDPCTCILKFFSKQKLSATSTQLKKSLNKHEKERLRGAPSLLSNFEEGARKSVKKIRHTTSKIKRQCLCFEEKAKEKLKSAKYNVKEKIDSMQTQYVKRHETESTIPFDELAKKVKKDSITKFREKLKQRKLAREFECERECSEEECVPEDCLEKLNLRRALRQKRKRQLGNTSPETRPEEEFKRITIKDKGLQSARISIEKGSKAAKQAASKLCACTLSLKKTIKSSVKLKSFKSNSSAHFTSASAENKIKNASNHKRKLGTKMRDKKRRAGTNTRYQSASSGTSYSVSTVRKPAPRVRAEQSAPNVGRSLKETGTDKETKFKLSKTLCKCKAIKIMCKCSTTKKRDRPSQVVKEKHTSNKYGLRRCFCTLKLTPSQKVKSKVKERKETSNQTISSTSAVTTTTSKEREKNIEQRKKRHHSTENRFKIESKSSVTSPTSSKTEKRKKRHRPTDNRFKIESKSSVTSPTSSKTEKRKKRHRPTDNRLKMESKSSVTSRMSSKTASLLPHECEPGVCIPEKCDPHKCLDIINKRDNVRKRNRRHKFSDKRFIMESKSSFTPTATPHKAKKVQSSMFAYKTEVQTQYNNNYKNSPEEAKRIQETPRISDLQTVKTSSSFSFNIGISKGFPHPINKISDHVSRQSIYELPKVEPMKREFKPQKSILKNKNKVPKKINKGTHTTTKSRNRIKCMCKKLYKKPKERPKVQYVSTSTETQLPPVTVTKTTKTKKSKINRKIVVGPYECEPYICVPGQCNPSECLEIINRRNQQFSKETGTSVDQKKRKTSSSFTDNMKMSDKAVPVRTRAMNQSTVVFNKEARRPAIIKHTSKESRKPTRQAVSIGSSFSFSIEFSKNRFSDPNSFESTYNNDKKNELKKHNKENRLKRCFCTMKLRNQKVSNVFAVNKFILDKYKSPEKKSIVYSTNKSQLSFVGSRYGFNFKEMQSYFNENKTLKGRSFLGSGGGSDVDRLNEVNLNNCYTFSEACYQRNKKLTATNLNEDRSYKSFSTSFSKSDVRGVSTLLKRCFCTMNIRIQEMENDTGRRFNLQPYEFEPEICVPGECNSNECQKLIQKRLIRKYSKMSETTIGSKSISVNTFRETSHLRETRLQANSQGGYRLRQRRGKPPPGIKYKSLPNKSNKQAVRIGSKFSFKIEFSNDKLQPEEDRTIRPMQWGQRTESTSYGSSTSDRYLQSKIRTRDMLNTDLKLQKAEKERKSNYVAMKEIKTTPIMSTTAQNTKPLKSERLKRILDPNECEPGTCMPRQCNPYECLENIKIRYKNTRDFGSGLGQSQRKSTSSITSKQKTHKIARQIQSRFRKNSVKSTITTITHSELPLGRRSGKSSRQALRVGSSFSFNIEFFKDKESPVSRPVDIHPKSKIRISSKTIGYLRTNVKGRGAPDSRAINHKDSQASTLSRKKSTMTTLFLKRCTAKWQGIKTVPSVLVPLTRTEAEKVQTDKIKTRSPKHISQNLEPYECPLEICVPAPGECDAYDCLRTINRRNKLLGTDMARSKSSYSSFKPLKQRKGRKVQNNQDHKRSEVIKRSRDAKGLHCYPVGDIKRPQDTKLLQSYSTGKSETKTYLSISGDSKRRQAYTGSAFSFNVDFLKEKSPQHNEILQATVRKLNHNRSQNTAIKENKIHQGSDSADIKTFDQMLQISRTITDKSMGTLPKRCFCTLKLQKKDQFNADKFERKLPPNAINRGMMTRNKYGWENPPERRQISYKLEPYECDPGVCIPGKCDTNECILRIQKRNVKESGTTTRYHRGRSISSLASVASTASRRVQYSSRPPRTTESAKIKSHQPRVCKYRQIPFKQVVRIGSSYSFNVEFFKDGSNNYSNLRTKVMGMHERKYKKSSQSIGSLISKIRSSMMDAQFLKRGFCTLKLQKSNKTLNPPMNMRNQNVYLATMHNLSPYECEPGFCIPGECDPHVCEKRIRQRNKQSKLTGMQKSNLRSSSSNTAGELNQTKWVQGAPLTRAAGVLSTSINKIKPNKKNTEKHRDAIKNHRQEVRIGSNFSFNIEFFKDNPSYEIQRDQMMEKKYIPTKSTGNTYHEKGKHMYSQIDDPRGKHMYSQIDDPRGKNIYSQYDPRGKDMVLQVDLAKAQPRGVGQLNKSCFCTLKLQKLGKHQREISHKGRTIQTSKSLKPPTPYTTQGAVGTSIPKKIKKDRGIDIKDMAAKTQTKKYKLLPYECEPGVCTPGLCDPYECLERIKQRELRNFGTSTGKNIRERYVDVGSKRKTLDTAQQMRHKAEKSAYTTYRRPGTLDQVPSYVAAKKENISNYPPGRQAVRIGSSFSFNIEFFKDTPYAMKDMQLDSKPELQDIRPVKRNLDHEREFQDIRPVKRNLDHEREFQDIRPVKRIQTQLMKEEPVKRIQTKLMKEEPVKRIQTQLMKEEMIGPSKRNAKVCTLSKVCNTVTRLNCSKECQNCPNTECKSTGMGPFLKRCFCTLKLQKPFDHSKLERYENKAGINKTLDKKIATKGVKLTKHVKGRPNLLPYECEPGFCTPGQCDPYMCLERIKQKNKAKKIGAFLPSQKSVTSGFCPGLYCTESCQTDKRHLSSYCPGPYCTESCQTDKRPKNRNEYHQQTDSNVEERRFKNVFGGQQGVKFGSNISFNIEFYKENLAPELSNVKAAQPTADNIGYTHRPTQNQTQYIKPKKDTKQTYANDRYHTTANTQSEGIKLQNKEIGVINSLKRCFCTLNLQKDVFDSSKQKVVTVNRVAIEDNRGPFGNSPQSNLEKNKFVNTSVVYRVKNIQTKLYKKQQKGGQTQVLYPYRPRKFNKNTSQTLLRYENKHTNLKKSRSYLRSHNIWPALDTNSKRVRRLTAKQSEHSLKVNTPEHLDILRNKSSLSKSLSGFRSVVGRCVQMFSKRYKDSKVSANLEKNISPNKYSKVGKLKSVPLPIENKNKFKINWQPKFSTEVSNPTQSEKYVNRLEDGKKYSILINTSKRKCKSEKAVENVLQHPHERSYNNKIICSYCQIQYEKDKLKPAYLSLVGRPNQNFLAKGQNDKYQSLEHKTGLSVDEQTNGCNCVSMCKCENCTGGWRTMLMEKREAKRLEQKETVIGKYMNALKTNLLKKKEPILKPKEELVPEQHDICARCCKHKNHIDPKSLCQGIKRVLPEIKAKQSVRGMPTDVSTDICVCELPCPCEKCHRNAIISELCDDRLSPQKYLLVSDNNYQTTVTEACLSENLKKNDLKSIHTPKDKTFHRPLRDSCDCMSCPYQKSIMYSNEAGPNKVDDVTGLSKIPEAGQINFDEAVNSKKKASKKMYVSKIKNIYNIKPFQKNYSVLSQNKISYSCQNSLRDNYQTVGTEAGSSKEFVCSLADQNNNPETIPIGFIKPIQNHHSDLCTCKMPCSCQKTPTNMQTNEFSCGDVLPQKYLLLSNGPQTDQVDNGYYTAKYDAKKQKLVKKKQNLERKKQELERKKQEREARKQERKMENPEKSTQIHKQPGDLCSCKFPCPCERTPKHVNVNEFSCDDDVLPQKYIFLRDGSHIVEDNVDNIGHETSKKQKIKKQKRVSKKKEKIKHDQITQVLKHPDDLCSCKFPCPCQRTPDKVHVNEFSCDNNVIPQKYLVLSDTPQNVQFYDTSEYDAKRQKLEKKRQKNQRKKQKKENHERKKQERKQELETLRRKREMEKLGKLTQTQKPPGDLCSCKFPCSCNRTPENVNVKEFSCNDNVLPQKYLLISDSPHLGDSVENGQSNVGHDTAKVDAIKRKLERKKEQDERKKQERERKKQEREALKREKLGKRTQTHKPRGDLCSCKFPCSCGRTPGDVNVKEFSCNDSVLPQKYLLINDSPQLGNSLADVKSNVGYDTAKYDASKPKPNKKRQLEKKRQKVARKKQEREVKNQKHYNDQQDHATQVHKHPNDLCNCKFPCSCKKTRKNVTVAELACNDWPGPQKYLLLSDTFENDNFEGSEVGHDTLKQDKKKQRIDLKKLKRDNKKKDTVTKQKRNKVTQIRKHSTDLCSCNFPCSCQKPHEKLKVSELACNDWPSPHKYLLLSEISKNDMLNTDQTMFGTVETLENVKMPRANRIDALEGIQIYTKDNQLNSLEATAKANYALQDIQINTEENQIDALEGYQIHTEENRINTFVDDQINTDDIKRDSKNFQADSDYDIVKHDSKKLKIDKKKEKRKSEKLKQIARNRIHKHRSELCTCKTPCSCQKSTKNLSEFSYGDSPIPQTYLPIQGNQIDISKSCQVTNSKECQCDADVVQKSDNSREKQNYEKFANDIYISELSGGDWPIRQKKIFGIGGHQTSNLQISQIDIPERGQKVAVEMTPFYENRKLVKQKEKRPKQIHKDKQNRIQQTPKDLEDLCICAFPCPCQKCPKTLDVTEFSLGDWPSPHRCLFVDDNDRTNDMRKSGAKFELIPRKAKEIKSAEKGIVNKGKVRNFFGKTKNKKRTELKEQWEEGEEMSGDAEMTQQSIKGQWKEAENISRDARRAHQTVKGQWSEAQNSKGAAGKTRQTVKKQGKRAKNLKDAGRAHQTVKGQWSEAQNSKGVAGKTRQTVKKQGKRAKNLKDAGKTRYTANEQRNAGNFKEDAVMDQFGEAESLKDAENTKHSAKEQRNAGNLKKDAVMDQWGEAESLKDAENTKHSAKKQRNAGNLKEDAVMDQWGEAESLKDAENTKHSAKEQQREAKNLKGALGKAKDTAKNKTGKARKDTGKTKKTKKKIKKNKLPGMENETQTQTQSLFHSGGGDLQKSSSVTSKVAKMDKQGKNLSNKFIVASVKIGKTCKWLEAKFNKCIKQYIPDPCICGIPECEEKMMKMRHKEKIITEKKCKCGVPTCEEKIKSFKDTMLKQSQSKSVPKSDIKSKSKKSKLVSESEHTKSKPKKFKHQPLFESESKSKMSKKLKKSKLKSEPDLDIKHKRKKPKKSKKSKLVSESYLDIEHKRKKPKKSKKSKHDSESDLDIKHQRKKSKKKSKLKSEPKTKSKSKKSKLQLLPNRSQATCLCKHTCLCAQKAGKVKLKTKEESNKKPISKESTKPESKKLESKKLESKKLESKKLESKKPESKKLKSKVPELKKSLDWLKICKPKPKPNACQRCIKSIKKRRELRRRRAIRRRKIKNGIKFAKKRVKKCRKIGGKFGKALSTNFVNIKTQVTSTQAVRRMTDTLERHYVSNFILHARDPKRRFNPKKGEEKEPHDFDCSLFMGSLRRRPWLCVYYMCPWFYPHCITFLNIWKQFTDIFLFLLAVGVWSPCILAIEICRAFVCCAFCTG